jgi:hypothetical protein
MINNLSSPALTYIFDANNVIDSNDFKRRALVAMPATQKIAANASESIYSHFHLGDGFSFHCSRVSSLISVTN